MTPQAYTPRARESQGGTRPLRGPEPSRSDQVGLKERKSFSKIFTKGKKESLIFIKHILESIKNIESYSKGISKNKFFEDKKLQDAIVRRIEIIGEAVKNLPDSFKNKYSNISWKEIVGTRDKIIHHYFGVDLEIVWEIIKKDLSELKKNIQDILKKEK